MTVGAVRRDTKGGLERRDAGGHPGHDSGQAEGRAVVKVGVGRKFAHLHGMQVVAIGQALGRE